MRTGVVSRETGDFLFKTYGVTMRVYLHMSRLNSKLGGKGSSRNELCSAPAESPFSGAFGDFSSLNYHRPSSVHVGLPCSLQVSEKVAL